MLVINVFVAIVGVAVANDSDRNEYLTTMGVSILYIVLFVPGTLFCWFLPAYHAYRYVLHVLCVLSCCLNDVCVCCRLHDMLCVCVQWYSCYSQDMHVQMSLLLYIL